jgi:hypothetical protein
MLRYAEGGFERAAHICDRLTGHNLNAGLTRDERQRYHRPVNGKGSA